MADRALAQRIGRSRWIPLAVVLVWAGLSSMVMAQEQDWEVPGGRYFPQTGGYQVTDRGGVPFWSEFQRLGGVPALGYPISRRFDHRGLPSQAFEKVVLQWRPEAGRAVFLDVFDELSAAGRDDWLLAEHSTPRPMAFVEDGQGRDEVVAAQLALLESHTAIRDAYVSSVEDLGLPMSAVEDMGELYALRTQRVVLQQWKIDTPWARAGEVVLANGGVIAKQGGLVPAAATEVERVARDAPGLVLINAYREAAAVAPARIHPALGRAAENHVAYYEANRGDPGLSGIGLHQERPGAPGFTGASMGDRARASGYSGGTVTENAGFGTIEQAIEWAMHTVNHRLPLIHPSATDMGYAVSGGNGFGIIAVGLTRDRLEVALPSVYPPDGATGVPLSWDGGEVPNPAPGVPRPLGYPLTVAFGVYQRVEWRSFGLWGPSGEALEVSTPRTDWMRAAALIPHRPLQPGQTHTARVEATVDGRLLAKEWTFTTGP